jgi:hypothetical protein
MSVADGGKIGSGKQGTESEVVESGLEEGVGWEMGTEGDASDGRAVSKDASTDVLQ